MRIIDAPLPMDRYAQTEGVKRGRIEITLNSLIGRMNLRLLGFVRGTNDEGQPQHFSWRKPVGNRVTVVVDLLCDADVAEGGQVLSLPGERRLSAFKIPGAHLAVREHVAIELTAALLDERGVATDTIQFANIVPFLVLKALSYDDRMARKDGPISYAGILTVPGVAVATPGTVRMPEPWSKRSWQQ